MTLTITPAKVTALRNAFRLNVDGWAEILCVHPMTVRRWERGKGPVRIDGWAAIAIRSLAVMPEPALTKVVTSVRVAYVHCGQLAAIGELAQALREVSKL